MSCINMYILYTKKMFAFHATIKLYKIKCDELESGLKTVHTELLPLISYHSAVKRLNKKKPENRCIKTRQIYNCEPAYKEYVQEDI